MILWLIIVGPTLILAMYAHGKVKSAFNKYSQIGNSSGMTGADAARRMLLDHGFHVVSTAREAEQGRRGVVAIERTRGFLSDHYDPRSHVLRLSPSVYEGRSLAAVGVACHEAGHALQHADEYAPLQLRSIMVPVASFGSWAAFPIIFLGAIMGAINLIWLGILIFTAIVLFQIVTLPVEFNATARAKRALEDLQIINNGQEQAGVAKVLDAAALTYVAAAVSSIGTLVYYVLIFTGMGRD